MKAKPQQWAVLVLIFVLAYFVTRVREGACAPPKEEIQVSVEKECAEQGGVFKDGQCVCPNGTI
jgi:hypothetical protein